MADWVLRRAAPRARRGLWRRRPLARDFYHRIARSSTSRARRGWIRVARPAEIAPGDLFAWLKPSFWRRRKNTGHVGFVIGTPRRHPRYSNVWVMRIADSTRLPHEEDSRAEGGRGGFGTAKISFLFAGDGAAIAYGWYGQTQDPRTFVPTKIAFGRVTR